MEEVIKYIKDTIGLDVTRRDHLDFSLGSLPNYITQSYKLSSLTLMDRNIVLAEQVHDYTVLQTYKHMQMIKKTAGSIVVLVLEKMQSYTRKRLIEKRINFIVPNKQLYLPELFIYLEERFSQIETKTRDKLMPSSQYLLIFHLISTYSCHLEELSFKEIAGLLEYTPMAITNAVSDLKKHDLVEVIGEKEKYIKFRFDKKELWDIALIKDILETPVLKTVFVDELPKHKPIMKSNLSALSEYTNLNPGRRDYFAVSKKEFSKIKSGNKLINENDREGEYAIEVWKYKPDMMYYGGDKVVDPLSLYLSLKDTSDERTEMALENLIENRIW